MTKDDIKKALECCSNPNTGSCKDCPYNYNDEFHCAYGEMCKDALDLITEQEKEIERLRTTLGQCSTDLNSALESLKSQCREIGALKAGIKQAKIDVLNKLKEEMGDVKVGMWTASQIDEFIKEVQNAENKS